MSILIGIRNEHASGASNSSEGFGTFSIDANSIHILKEGSKVDLAEYVKIAREEGEVAQKVLNDMEDEFGEYTNLTSDQWDELESQMLEKTFILKFSKLLILEGIVI